MTLSGTSLARKRGTTQPRADDVLAWYDRHRRNLPWRAKPGETPDPYRVWLSEIMLQQTTVRAVAPYYARFLERLPNVEQLAAAELSDVLKLWAGLGYYARARNLHACAKVIVERHGGQFPRTLAELAESLTPDARTGDFAQALMDLGATICTPKKPACALCPWNVACAAFRRGDAESFPRKAAKPEGTLRRGAAFVAIRADGFVLTRTRPASGLLGAMTEVPTTAWTSEFDARRARDEAPLRATWQRVPGVVRHTFTHFPLELTVYRAEVPPGTAAPEGARFLPLSEVAGEAFPNLMRKVLASAGIDPRPADPPGRSPRRSSTHR